MRHKLLFCCQGNFLKWWIKADYKQKISRKWGKKPHFRLIFGRSDRIRTCGIDVPNVARYQLRHTPKCEKYSIFRSFSVSGQICGQNIVSVFF